MTGILSLSLFLLILSFSSSSLLAQPVVQWGGACEGENEGCGVWVYCEYTVDPVTAVCETGWTGPPPHYGTSPTKVKSCKWQPCGTACCRRTYTVCIEEAAFGLRFRNIQLVSKQKLGDCSGQSQYAKPCQDGC